MFLGETDLTECEKKVTVNVKCGGMEQTFTGDANDVWVSVNKFFGEMIPTFDLARKIALTVDLVKLIEDFRDVIAIAPEGPELLIPKDKLTDSEVLQFYLLAAYVGFRLGKRLTEVMTKEELQAKLGKSMKITRTRLGELVKQGTAVKTDDGAFRIATIGIKKLQEELTAIKAEVW
jgi:hypothetical protein